MRTLYNAPMSSEFENAYANGVKMVGGTARSPRGVRFEGDEGGFSSAFTRESASVIQREPAEARPRDS